MAKNNNQGVSPVIATILMVAITVVLAAVLYLMVSQFTGGGGATAPTGTVSASSVSTTAHALEFGRFSPDTAPTEIKLLITHNTTVTSECTFASDDDAAMTCTAAFTGTATYADLADNKLLNVGDKIGIVWADAGAAKGTWQIQMLHIDTGEEINGCQFTK
jgi:flagellin-like protein